MSSDLDVRAREASDAARASVVGATADAMARRPSMNRRPLGLRTAAVAAAVVIIGVVAVALARGPESTGVRTGPAARPAATVPPRPGLSPPSPGPGGVLLTTGTAGDGRPWALSIGGPSNDLCFTMTLDAGVGSGGCAGRPGGQPEPAEERYRPHLHNDSRLRPFVWGRVPPGVAQVEVEVSGAGSLGRRPVVVGGGEADGFYALELDRGASPRAVVGTRPDNTTVRYEVPGEVTSHDPIVPQTWWDPPAVTMGVGALIALGLLLTALVVLACRRSARRRDSGSSGGSQVSR